MKTIIKNGTVVTSGSSFTADILIEGEKIISIGNCSAEAVGEEEDTHVIDAAGKYVFPGAVDVHTHMDLDVGISRAVDDFYDGTVAAVCGGTTAIVDHMAFGPEGIPLHHMFREYEKLAGGKAVIDYGFHGTMQHLDDDILAELETMMSDGIPSVKLYMTYNYKMNDAEILQTLRKMKEIHGITAFHCENHEVTEFLKKGKSGKGKSCADLSCKEQAECRGSRGGGTSPSSGKNGRGCAGLHCTLIPQGEFGSSPSGKKCRAGKYFRRNLSPISYTDRRKISGERRIEIYYVSAASDAGRL